MRKHHFSRAETRAMALDHPIGDPTGGAAYGEKNDPISAIVSLATMGGTYATAATAAGAAGLTGIGATFSAMTVMQGITFAGAALSLVGNVTGNQTLSKIGMVAGIAGGIGQLAGIQTPQLGSTSLGRAAGLTEIPKNAAVPLSQTAAPPPPASQNVTGVDTSTAAGAMARSGTAPVESTNVVGGGASPGAAEAMAARSATAPAAAPAVSPAAASATDVTGTAKSFAGNNLNTAPASTGSAWDAVKGAGKSVLEFTEKYPGAAIMLGSTAQTLADYLSGKTDAELDKLEAEKSFFGAKTNEIQEAINNERRRRQNRNLAYTAGINTGFTVNPNANIQPAGLIAQQMPQA